MNALIAASAPIWSSNSSQLIESISQVNKKFVKVQKRSRIVAAVKLSKKIQTKGQVNLLIFHLKLTFSNPITMSCSQNFKNKYKKIRIFNQKFISSLIKTKVCVSLTKNNKIISQNSKTCSKSTTKKEPNIQPNNGNSFILLRKYSFKKKEAKAKHIIISVQPKNYKNIQTIKIKP